MGKFVEQFHRVHKLDAIPGGGEEVLADLGVKQAMKQSKLLIYCVITDAQAPPPIDGRLSQDHLTRNALVPKPMLQEILLS